MTIYKEYLDKAKQNFQQNKAFYKSLAKKKPSDLDSVVEEYHQQVFEQIDCLKCGLCCRTLGPRLTDTDIQRLAKAIKQKPSQVTQNYLQIDEDNDYVFKTMPCPFLSDDNFCRIYSERPKACREYPHTDRRRFVQILDLTLKNTLTCPAVYLVTEKLKQHYQWI